MKLNREELLKALDVISKLVKQDQLGPIQIDIQDREITISAEGDYRRACKSIKTTEEDVFKFEVGNGLLRNVLKRFECEYIELELLDCDIQITGDNSVVTMPYVKDFYDIDFSAGNFKELAAITYGDLREMIKKVIHCVAAENKQSAVPAVRYCVYFIMDEDSLEVLATDGYIASRAKTSLLPQEGRNEKFLLHKGMLDQLVALNGMAAKDIITIANSNDAVMFWIDDVNFKYVATQTDGELPSLDMLEFDYIFTSVNTKQLINALTKVSLITKAFHLDTQQLDVNPCVSISTNLMEIYINRDKKRYHAYESIEIDFDGECCIHMQIDNFLKILTAVKESECMVGLIISSERPYLTVRYKSSSSVKHRQYLLGVAS